MGCAGQVQGKSVYGFIPRRHLLYAHNVGGSAAKLDGEANSEIADGGATQICSFSKRTDTEETC